MLPTLGAQVRSLVRELRSHMLQLRVCMKVKVKSENHSVVSDSLRPHGLYSPWNSPGQNIGVGSLSLLHGIFPSWGSNSGLPHCRQIFYPLSYQGRPKSSHTLQQIWNILHTTIKTQHSRINKYLKRKENDFEVKGAPRIKQMV